MDGEKRDAERLGGHVNAERWHERENQARIFSSAKNAKRANSGNAKALCHVAGLGIV
jgi:hypothetical protein